MKNENAENLVLNAEPTPRFGRSWMEPTEALKLIPAFTKVISPKSDVSEKYTPVQTKEIHKLLTKEGWKMTKAATLNRNQHYTGHMAIYNHPDFKTKDGDEIRIMLTNSFDRTYPLKLSIGVFRIVCGNGLIVTSQDMGQYNHKHIGINSKEFSDMFTQQLKNVAAVTSKIEVMQSRMLTKKERIDLAERMIEIKSPNTKNWEILPANVLKTKRPEDEGNSLWQVFNTVQENLVKGGVDAESKSKAGKVKALRPLKNAFDDVYTNAKYFEVAISFVEN